MALIFSIKSKSNPVTAKIEMEKLFFDVKCNESQRKIEIHDEADLKVKLQNFDFVFNYACSNV